jgi:hypothetical protein
MAESTTVETNGTAAGANRIKGKAKPASKQGRLYALAQKATNKAGTIRRSFDNGETFSLRFSGFPAGVTAAGVEETAGEGGSVGVRAPVGSASLSLRGKMGGDDAAELAREMIAED